MPELLLHKLPRTSARNIFYGLSEMSPESLPEAAAYEHSDARPPAIGGTPAPESLYRSIRTGLLGIVKAVDSELGNDVEQRREFDVRAAGFLHTELPIRPRVAADPEVWSFLCCVVVPDVTRWRFPNFSIDRFAGGVRNTLQRLWVRAAVLCDSDNATPYHLLNDLPEDPLVQIFERPAIWNDWSHARVIAERLVNARQSARERFNFQTLVRRTMLEIRQLMPIASLAILPIETQRSVIDEIIRSGLHHLADEKA